MQAEIIAVGDELVSGQRLDTNSQWLSKQLAYLGITVDRHVTIGDQMLGNIQAMQEAAERSQIVLISGGLGPTLDDLTREAMSSAFGLPLELDDASLEHIEQLFARRGRPMPERNRVQAMFPRGTIAIPNPHGSAPGIDLTVERSQNRCRLFALPGVPAEMQQMWHATVLPRLEQQLGSDRGALFFRAVKLFGMGESDVEARVPTLIARDRYPTVGITVSQATITLRVAARAKSAAEFEQLIAPTLCEIHESLGDLIFGYENDELSDALLRELAASRHSVAVLEIGASSGINEALQTSAGSCAERADQRLYRGGIVLPDQLTAQNWWQNACVNGQAAGTSLAGSALAGNSITDIDLMQQLARTVRLQFAASIGLCVGTYPSQAEILQSPAGAPFPFTIAIDAPGVLPTGAMVDQRSLGGHPEVLNPRAAKTAIDLLRKQLRSHQ